jgi:hypothetical protein
MIVRSEVYTPHSTLAWEAEELRKSVGRLDQLLKGFLSLCRAFSDSLALCSGGYDRTGQPAARPCRRSLSVDY